MKTSITCLLAFILSIYAFNANAEKTASDNKYLIYEDEIVRDFVCYMEQKYRIHCYGSGGSMPHDVEKIEVLFQCYNKTTIQEARKIMVDAIQELLQRINSHEKIRPYLREYPFNEKRVGVSISFDHKKNISPPSQSLVYVFSARDRIFYRSINKVMVEPHPLTVISENNEPVTTLIGGGLKEFLVPIMDESFQEALKIIESQSSIRKETDQ